MISTGGVSELYIGEHTKVPALDKSRAGACHRSILSPILWHLRLCCSCSRQEKPSEGRLLLTAFLVFSLGQASPGGRACSGSQMVLEGQGSTAGSQPLGCRR